MTNAEQFVNMLLNHENYSVDGAINYCMNTLEFFDRTEKKYNIRNPSATSLMNDVIAELRKRSVVE